MFDNRLGWNETYYGGSLQLRVLRPTVLRNFFLNDKSKKALDVTREIGQKQKESEKNSQKQT